MTRAAPSGFSDDSMYLFYAVEFEFDSGTVRLWNGYTDAQIEGETYQAAGDLLNISNVEENGEIAARGASVTLTGLDTSLVSVVLSEDYQNRPARIMFGTIESGVYSAYTLFKGRMDVMSITEDGQTASIDITIENRLIDLERPRVYRYTSEDQKAKYPSDLGLDYVADLQDKQILWGRN